MATEQPGSLLAEIDHAIERLNKVAVIDPKKELTDNVYPLVRMVAESVGQVLLEHVQHFGAIDQRIEVAEGAIAELATAGDSLVLPDLAGRIDETLSIGLQVCAAVEQYIENEAGDGTDVLRAAVKKYRESVSDLRDELDDVTVDTDDEPEDEKEGSAK